MRVDVIIKVHPFVAIPLCFYFNLSQLVVMKSYPRSYSFCGRVSEKVHTFSERNTFLTNSRTHLHLNLLLWFLDFCSANCTSYTYLDFNCLKSKHPLFCTTFFLVKRYFQSFFIIMLWFIIYYMQIMLKLYVCMLVLIVYRSVIVSNNHIFKTRPSNVVIK